MKNLAAAIGWRNLWRNRRRTLIELSAVAGAITIAVFFVNLAKGAYSQMINNGVRGGSGHVAVYHEKYLGEKEIAQAFDPAAAVDALGEIEGVSSVFLRVHGFGLIRSSRDNRAGAVLGLDIEKEKAVHPLIHDGAVAEGRMPEPGRTVPEAALGIELAESLDLKIGNRFVWSCQGASGGVEDHLLRVSGVLKTGMKELDRNAMVVNLEDASKIVGAPGMVHEIAVLLNSPALIDGVYSSLNQALEITTAESGIKVKSPGRVRAYRWDQAMPQLTHAIRLDQAANLMLLGLIFVIVAIGTTNTLIMAVMERTREFGVLRALGAERALIAKVVLFEAFSLAVVGSLVGLALGSALTLYTAIHGIDFSGMMDKVDVEFAGIKLDMIIYSGWNLPAMGFIIAAIFGLTLCAAVYPAVMATRVEPADAMKGR